MTTICINASLLCKPFTGIERYAFEVLLALDQQDFSSGSPCIEAIFPETWNPKLPQLNTIKSVAISGWKSDHDYFTLRKYLKSHGAWFCSLGPKLIPQQKSIICFHDLRPITHPEYDALSFRLKYLLSLNAALASQSLIVTNSEWTKRELFDYAKHNLNSLTIAPIGWDHIKRINSDKAIFFRYPRLREGEYFYTLGSLAQHKNIQWVYEVAKRNADSIFAIAGGRFAGSKLPFEAPNNVIHLGYVTDEESKALMEGCRAFLHPSKYEGFGIPPLEALACGAKVFAAKGTAVELTCSDAISYFDPDDYDVDVHELLKTEVTNEERITVLNHYTWKNAAYAWWNLFSSLK